MSLTLFGRIVSAKEAKLFIIGDIHSIAHNVTIPGSPEDSYT